MSSTEPTNAENVRNRVHAELDVALAGITAQAAAYGDRAERWAGRLADFLVAGKRLRAAFCYWAWRAEGGPATGPASDAVIRAGAALEIFQAAALIHDDVIDDSDTRRGDASVHRQFEMIHNDDQLSGDARFFGISAAVLLGDLALIESERLFRIAAYEATPSERHRRCAHDVFDGMRSEVAIGQYLDVRAECSPWSPTPQDDIDRAMEVLRIKSARYSVERPLVLGATLAGADNARLALWSSFGLPVGEAFQLRDDILGVFGDPATTGKPAGDDLREGKRTALVGFALRDGTEADRELLQSRIGDPSLTDADIDAMRGALVRSNAVATTEEVLSRLLDQARSHFHELSRSADPEPVAILQQLVIAATERDT